MELDGRLVDNLAAAVRSARRLRGKAVYPQTLLFWRELLTIARQALATMIDDEWPKIRMLADQLEEALRAFDVADSGA